MSSVRTSRARATSGAAQKAAHSSALNFDLGLCVRHGPSLRRISAYGVSLAVGGNRFVSAFVCGIALRYLRRSETIRSELQLVDDVGYLLSAAMWFVFGATAVLALTFGVPWGMVLFGLLALTVVRLFAGVDRVARIPFLLAGTAAGRLARAARHHVHRVRAAGVQRGERR
jgi:hypothetical protein